MGKLKEKVVAGEELYVSITWLSLQKPWFIVPFLLGVLLSLCWSLSSLADLAIGVEGGAIWQNRNDLQRPVDSEGTREEIDQYNQGPFPFYRVELFYLPKSSHHGFRVLYAPLTLKYSGELDQTVNFSGESFAEGAETDFTYTFNSYRATYYYAFWGHGANQLNLGFTLKVREAETKLEQAGVSESFTNFGFVPLIYFTWQKSLGSHWQLRLAGDALGGGPGRAIDVSLKLRRSFGESLFAGFGYRTLEGGADNDEIFTFSWFNYALAELVVVF